MLERCFIEQPGMLYTKEDEKKLPHGSMGFTLTLALSSLSTFAHTCIQERIGHYLKTRTIWRSAG